MNDTPQAVQELAAKYNTDPAKVRSCYDLYIKLGYKKELAEALTESDIISEQRRKR